MPDGKHALGCPGQCGCLPVGVARGSPQGPAAARACQPVALLPAAGDPVAVTENVSERPGCEFPDRENARETGIGAFGTVRDHAAVTGRINHLSPALAPDRQRHVRSTAWGPWAAVASREFREPHEESDIEIYFGARQHGDTSAFDGPGGVLTHAFVPLVSPEYQTAVERWR
ncbi:matrixin family metalloprotease [Streptomyces sp. NPDC055099]